MNHGDANNGFFHFAYQIREQDLIKSNKTMTTYDEDLSNCIFVEETMQNQVSPTQCGNEGHLGKDYGS